MRQRASFQWSCCCAQAIATHDVVNTADQDVTTTKSSGGGDIWVGVTAHLVHHTTAVCITCPVALQHPTEKLLVVIHTSAICCDGWISDLGPQAGAGINSMNVAVNACTLCTLSRQHTHGIQRLDPNSLEPDQTFEVTQPTRLWNIHGSQAPQQAERVTCNAETACHPDRESTQWSCGFGHPCGAERGERQLPASRDKGGNHKGHKQLHSRPAAKTRSLAGTAASATYVPTNKTCAARNERTTAQSEQGQADRKQTRSMSHGRNKWRTAAASKQSTCSVRPICEAATASQARS
jgi:hypothetical protein